jgi:hypothetical protein
MCKECEACPFNIYSELSMEANNLGCLPDYQNILEDYKTKNEVWACHEEPDKVCSGFTNYFKEKGSEKENLNIKELIENKQLMHDWSIHGKKYDFIGFLKSYIKKGSVVEINNKGTFVVVDFNNFNNMYFLNENGKLIVDTIENIVFYYYSNDKKFIELKELRNEAKNL